MLRGACYVVFVTCCVLRTVCYVLCVFCGMCHVVRVTFCVSRGMCHVSRSASTQHARAFRVQDFQNPNADAGYALHPHLNFVMQPFIGPCSLAKQMFFLPRNKAQILSRVHTAPCDTQPWIRWVPAPPNPGSAGPCPDPGPTGPHQTLDPLDPCPAQPWIRWALP